MNTQHGLKLIVWIVLALFFASCATTQDQPTPQSVVENIPTIAPSVMPTLSATSTIQPTTTAINPPNINDEDRNLQEQVIRAYFVAIDAHDWHSAYALLASPNLEPEAIWAEQRAEAWDSVKVVSIRTVSEWHKVLNPDARGTLAESMTGTAENPTYAVDFDVQWQKDWIPVIPNGINTQFFTLTKQDQAWKIKDMGSAP